MFKLTLSTLLCAHTRGTGLVDRVVQCLSQSSGYSLREYWDTLGSAYETYISENSGTFTEDFGMSEAMFFEAANKLAMQADPESFYVPNSSAGVDVLVTAVHMYANMDYELESSASGYDGSFSVSSSVYTSAAMFSVTGTTTMTDSVGKSLQMTVVADDETGLIRALRANLFVVGEIQILIDIDQDSNLSIRLNTGPSTLFTITTFENTQSSAETVSLTTDRNCDCIVAILSTSAETLIYNVSSITLLGSPVLTITPDSRTISLPSPGDSYFLVQRNLSGSMGFSLSSDSTTFSIGSPFPGEDDGAASASPSERKINNKRFIAALTVAAKQRGLDILVNVAVGKGRKFVIMINGKSFDLTPSSATTVASQIQSESTTSFSSRFTISSSTGTSRAVAMILSKLPVVSRKPSTSTITPAPTTSPPCVPTTLSPPQIMYECDAPPRVVHNTGRDVHKDHRTNKQISICFTMKIYPSLVRARILAGLQMVYIYATMLS